MKFGRGGAATLAWMVAMGCGTSSNDIPPPAGNTPVGTTPPGADGDAGGSPPAPDPGPPAPAPPIVGVPIDGVFVSATKGDDAADGTKQKPVKTLARAIVIAKEKQTLPIIACTETYNESVTLADGIGMYGYYDCSSPDWKKSELKAKVVSPNGPALTADGLTKSTRVEGFEFRSPNIAGTPADGVPAATSYAMVVRNTNGLELGNLRVEAGNGQDGVDGVASTDVNGFVKPSAASGDAATGPLAHSCSGAPPFKFCNFNAALGQAGGGDGGVGTCKFGAAGGAGGGGGTGRVWVGGGFSSTFFDANLMKGQPLVATSTTAQGGSAGANGGRGPFGANGTLSWGENGLTTGDGTAGAIGLPGQGGGGGDGRWDWGSKKAGNDTLYFLPPSDTALTGTGAGGGAGGCGGMPGTAGRGGGGSIGIFVVGSPLVTISNTTVVSGNGGRGGVGAAGDVGTVGGLGGTSSGSNSVGFPGFAGGSGGRAGQSGHGAPGPSIALVYHGARPTTTDVTLTFGSAGAAGGAVTDGAQTLPAPTQVAQQEYGY